MLTVVLCVQRGGHLPKEPFPSRAFSEAEKLKLVTAAVGWFGLHKTVTSMSVGIPPQLGHVSA